MQTFFLDTETTGLHPPHDKLVEVAIIDEAGDVVLDTLVNPERPIGFATQIHGISDAMVGVTGIEPVTPSMSTKCSPAELHPHTISSGRPINPA